MSGGLFRDLLWLPGQLLLTVKDLPAEESAFARAESTLRSDYELTLTREQLELLRDVSTTHELIPANEQWADATDLISSGAVLRYPNGEKPWCGVHPLLTTLL